MGHLQGAPVVVIGAGLGGLAAALALTQRGALVSVYEQAPDLAEVGAGVQLGPNAVKVLDALGLGAEARARLDPASHVDMIDALSGARFARIRFGADALRRWGAPMLQAHRADLLTLLDSACRGAGVKIRTGVRANLAEVSPGRVRLDLGGPQHDAPLVIAADGLWSTARDRLAPGHRPVDTGHTAWRALIPMADVPQALRGRTTLACGAGAHLVSYPLRGGEVLNVVMVEERRLTAAPSGWEGAGDADGLRARHASWSPPLRAALEAAETLRPWPLLVHAPLPRWSHHGLVVLGDAAHPMLPYFAQGASMALEDAFVLAACLDAARPETALARYERLRKPRATRVQRAAQRNGAVYHAEGPKRWAVRTALRALSATAPWALHQRFDWLYGADVTL